jgi:hypothetical protein
MNDYLTASRPSPIALPNIPSFPLSSFLLPPFLRPLSPLPVSFHVLHVLPSSRPPVLPSSRLPVFTVGFEPLFSRHFSRCSTSTTSLLRSSSASPPLRALFLREHGVSRIRTSRRLSLSRLIVKPHSHLHSHSPPPQCALRLPLQLSP